MSPQQIASHLNSINLKTIWGKKFRTGTSNMYLKRGRELQLFRWSVPFHWKSEEAPSSLQLLHVVVVL
ncbi:hypothetical protein ACFS7Z_20975 [Pontibacter toksunensis]|uniref:Uncharacterized protein n=1 Tax=Pontibacter toksunensis TaxID=1332631 RepID=A0ABW6BYH4_9BACT